ncbi:DUF2939 domain-containing protein [Hymenobacter aerilatus]|uniref:DUF2939 domain-containing protein n=1 Tax=Hymenobacter aerilatus TaxID=2932251 RepID=A0A8T9SVU2_9BACT|nr:DUF2939 domain-containing protein [Hymenobacter aerilatus]UOR04843.1 DUF2939 domain-containing protein [Hymenobacter aerilatus]
MTRLFSLFIEYSTMKKAFLLVTLLSVLIGGYWYYRTTAAGPKYSLLKAAAAVQSHDVAAFEQYVDVESIASDIVDQVTTQRTTLKLLNPGGVAFMSSLRLLKPQLAAAAREEVQRYVETGSVEAATAAQSKRPLNVSILGLAGKMVSPDSKFKDVKYVKEESSEQALVGLEFTQPAYDTTLVLELKMIKRDDHWQVTQVTNTDELIRHVARLEKQRMLRK